MLQFDILRRNISTLRHFISLPIPSQHFLKNSIIKINILGKWASYFILYFSYVDLFPICIFHMSAHFLGSQSWRLLDSYCFSLPFAYCKIDIPPFTCVQYAFYRYICRFYELVSDDMLLSWQLHIGTAAFGYSSAYGDSCIWIFFGIYGHWDSCI